MKKKEKEKEKKTEEEEVVEEKENSGCYEGFHYSTDKLTFQTTRQLLPRTLSLVLKS